MDKGRCDKHQADYFKQADEIRGTAAQRGYDHHWAKRVRAAVLERDKWLCQVCRLLDATEVDHIRPKHKGGTDDLSNLQAICHDCHSLKTAREQRERFQQRATA